MPRIKWSKVFCFFFSKKKAFSCLSDRAAAADLAEVRAKLIALIG